MDPVAPVCSADDQALPAAISAMTGGPAMMIHSGLAGIVSAWRRLRSTDNEFVLATIVETQGSTYRKAGARMLITRSGAYCGLLGGGCFESDLIEHARGVFETRRPRELFYDMRSPEDLVWGLGLGCNGAVRIWLEHLGADNEFAPLSLLETALATESPAVLITTLPVGADAAGRHYLYGDTDKVPVELNPPDEYLAQAAVTFAAGGTALLDIDTGSGPMKCFFNRIEPPVRLLIIGGGPDAQPVTTLAGLLGWQVSVVDFREAYSKPENFPAATRVICAGPEQLAESINLDKTDAVVLMTHKYEHDLRYLQQLTNPSLRYIGLLGPTARRNELLRAIGRTLSTKLMERVYGPVGLDIGGELPEEIALALLAEIQAVLHDRRGGHLAAARTGPAPIADPGRLGCIVLAAGGSTRFGALKQLLEYEGHSLLNRAVGLACELFEDRVIVVHGPKATKCQRDIAAYQVKNLVNEDWQRGMSASIALAAGAVPADYDAVLILLCDQPLIGREQIKRLLDAHAANPDRIIASAYAGTSGVPVIIPKNLIPRLQLLRGDQGARTLLAELADQVISIPVPEAEFDIDTQEDFSRLLFRDRR